MKIDVYQSNKDSTKFLSVPSGTNVANLTISEAVAKYFSGVSPHRKALSIDASDRRIAMDSADVISQIQDKGYAVHGIELRFIEST